MAATRIKICCIASEDEAATAVRLGADAVGLVSAMPSGPGVIDEARIAAIAATVPPGVARFLLTARRDVDGIVAQQRRTGTDTLQLVDEVDPELLDALRARLPGIRLVAVVHVAGADAVDRALRLARAADALLLDSGAPKAAVPRLGGTGRVHDWSLSRRIVESVPRPVYLAGGLRPDNVGEAIRRVGPFGVDVCSGVRTDGRLDETKLAAFVAAVHEGQAHISV